MISSTNGNDIKFLFGSYFFVKKIKSTTIKLRMCRKLKTNIIREQV